MFGLLLLASGIVISPLLPIDEAGYEKLLRSHRNKVLLVDFWATWCEPCRAEMRPLAQLDKKLRERGLILATISIDDLEQEPAARALLKASGIRPPAYLKQVKNDEAFINFVDPSWSGALPALFLYDRNGSKVKSFVGETAPDQIEAEIRKLL